MTAKMLDVQTGTLLWAGEGTGSLKSGLATFGGAVVGAEPAALCWDRLSGTRTGRSSAAWPAPWPAAWRARPWSRTWPN